MNKKGAISGGMVILILVLAVFAYTQNFLGFKDLLSPAPTTTTTTQGTNGCPSSGLTSVTINAQKALASTATNANVSYYVYDNGQLIASGVTGSTGSTTFNVACGEGKSYQAFVDNEVSAAAGFYDQQFNIDASGPTFTKTLSMYQYGTINVASIVSSADPTGGANFSAGTGKTCGFTVTFADNASATAIQNPLILVLGNATAITKVTMDGVTAADSLKPQRISTPSGMQYWTFAFPGTVKSTDAAVKVSGKVQFNGAVSVKSTAKNENLSVIIIDQAAFRTASYKTLSLTNGFITAAENRESLAQVGAPDSNRQTSGFKGSYC